MTLVIQIFQPRFPNLHYKLEDRSSHRLFLQHHAKIAAINAMKPPQYCRTFVSVNKIVNSTHFLLNDSPLDNPAAQVTCLVVSFVLQPLCSVKKGVRTLGYNINGKVSGGCIIYMPLSSPVTKIQTSRKIACTYI